MLYIHNLMPWDAEAQACDRAEPGALGWFEKASGGIRYLDVRRGNFIHSYIS